MSLFNVVDVARRWSYVLAIAGLAACGGGGGSSGTPAGTTPGTGSSFQAAKITLSATPASLNTAGGNATVTATVTNSSDGALAAQTVSFTTSSGTLQTAPTVTDATGVAVGNIAVGADKSNRVITVTVTSGTISKSIDIPVTGTKLSNIVLNGTLIQQGGSTFTVRALDSAGNGIPDAKLGVSSSLGNTAIASVTTDAAGFAQIAYVPTKSGADTLSVSGLGATSVASISSPSFLPTRITLVAAPPTLGTGSGTTVITAMVKNPSDTSLAGQSISFSTSSGILLNPPTVTDINGVASANLSTGIDRSNRTITVTVTSGTISTSVEVAVSGTKLSISGPVALTLGSGAATYTVKALDSTGAPVAGAVLGVSSSLGNTLGAATVTTDSSGLAQVAYTPAKSGSDSIAVSGLGTSTQTQVTINGVSTLELSASADFVPTASGTVLITAVVKNTSNNAVAGQPVSFSSTSGVLQGATATTNASGIATVTLTPGSDKSNRTVAVTASVGTATSVINIPVAGTKLSIAGPSSLLASAGPTTYAVRAQDSAGAAISGATLNLTSALHNGLSATSVTTDSSGFAQFIYTATTQGIDTITLTGLGISTQLSISISGRDFSFVTPGSAASLPTASAQPLTVQLRDGGVGIAGQSVTFSTTRGSVSPVTATTDESGLATVNVTSTTAGPATLTVSVGSVTATQQIEFVALVPAAITLQANPNAVAPNVAGSTTNRSTLTAVVRDATGNPVKNANVSFSSVDLSGGSVTPATGVTDSNGQVQSTFIAGAVSSPTSGVTVTAAVISNPSINSSTTLTVSGRSVFITIGTGNVIANLNETTYSKPFSVYVTDANGAAVVNQPVVLSIFPDVYLKGGLQYNGSRWDYTVTSPTPCINEDLNKNGIKDPGEDTNGDGKLTPGGVVFVQPGTVTTDTTGIATFNVIYGEQYALWANTTIGAKALVAGSESSSSYNFTLSALASDLTNKDVPPAGVVSPFGQSTSCLNAQ